MSCSETLPSPAARARRRAALRRVALSLAAALVAACAGDSLTAPSPSLAVGASGGTVVTTVPFDVTGYSPCGNGGAGEQVELRGELMIAYGTTESAGGLTRHRVHSQPLNVSGVGLATGDAYRLVGVGDNGYTDPLGPGEQATLTSSFRLLAAGAEGDLHVHVAAHVTVTADGTITARVEHATYECR